MLISELFDVSYGHSLELSRLTPDDDGIAFVSRTAKTNGVSGRVAPIPDKPPAEAGQLSVALGGSVLETFLQPESFYTGYHVALLKPKRAMTTEEKLWWAYCIRANKYRYNYGRQANLTLASLSLPDETPTWVEALSLPDLADMKEAVEPTSPPTMDVSKWKEFKYDELFVIKRGRYVPAKDKKPGKTKTITSTSMNNGVGAFTNLEPEHPGGTITVARNGSVGEAFLQSEPFFATDDVHVFYPREPVPYDAQLFLCSLIRCEAFRYNYGRKWSLGGMRQTRIKLPVTSEGKPDWDKMTSYIRALPYSSAVSTSAISEPEAKSAD